MIMTLTETLNAAQTEIETYVNSGTPASMTGMYLGGIVSTLTKQFDARRYAEIEDWREQMYQFIQDFSADKI